MSGEALAFVYFPKASVERDANELTAINVSAATGAVTNAIWTLHDGYSVQRFKVQITTAVAYDTPTALAIVKLMRRVTFGTDTGAVELGRITIPDGAVAGDCYYIDIPPDQNSASGDCMAGNQLLINVHQAGTGGAALAGAYRAIVEGGPRTENLKNMLDGTGHQTMYQDTTTVQLL